MWHAVAVKTILPTLRSAREFCSMPRPPEILASGTPQQCWDYLSQPHIKGGRLTHPVEAAVRGLPVFATEHYTYFIVEDKRGGK